MLKILDHVVDYQMNQISTLTINERHGAQNQRQSTFYTFK